MSEQFIPHPPSPQPEKKDTITFTKKNLAIAFLAVSLFILIFVTAIGGSNEDANNTSSNTTVAPAPVYTNPPVTSPPVNKYDAYLEHVYNNSGQANTISKASLIEYGDIVCEVLDNGNSIAWVVNYLSQRSTGSSDVDLYASVVYGAITYICPEYKSDLDSYLAN